MLRRDLLPFRFRLFTAGARGALVGRRRLSLRLEVGSARLLARVGGFDPMLLAFMRRVLADQDRENNCDDHDSNDDCDDDSSHAPRCSPSATVACEHRVRTALTD